MAATETLPARPLAGTDEALLVAQIEFTRWTADGHLRIAYSLPCLVRPTVSGFHIALFL